MKYWTEAEYREHYRPLDNAIHWSLKCGEKVRLSHYVVIEEGCQIGDRTFVGDFVKLRSDTKIGSDCIIGNFVMSEGNCVIGNRTHIFHFSGIGWGCKIGNDCWLGPNFQGSNSKIISYGRPHLKQKEKERRDPYTIGNGVRIGTRVLLMPGVKIGDDALLYAGSLITKNVPARAIMKGSPAKQIGEVPEEECLYVK